MPRSAAERRNAIGLVLPAFILLLIVNIAPLLVLLGLSFSDYELGAVDVSFVGGCELPPGAGRPDGAQIDRQYLPLCGDRPARCTFLALLVAFLVHGRQQSRAIYEVIYFLPVTSTLVAMATVWMFLLHPSIGPINQFLHCSASASQLPRHVPGWSSRRLP